ncbi:hypothetical protein ISS37_03675 [candidate division KSB1 bacterium]|nr:hypothetical protein [candidate division KSB1 bacterium]
MKSRWRTKNISYIAAFSAAAVAVGFLLAALPNVELVTATVFISGAVGGKSKGAMVGALAESIFSGLNPMGSGLSNPPLFAAQILGMAAVGYVGGWCDGKISRGLSGRIMGAGIGLFLTLFYQILTNLGSSFLVVGFNLQKILLYLAGGLAFAQIHILTNTLIFLIVLPAALNKLTPIIHKEYGIDNEE